VDVGSALHADALLGAAGEDPDLVAAAQRLDEVAAEEAGPAHQDQGGAM